MKKGQAMAANCPVCNFSGPEYSAALDNGYKLLRCAGCELLFAFPRPSLEELKSVYDASPDPLSHHSPDETRRLGLQYQTLFADCSGTGTRVLEIGCNTGFALHGLEQLGYEVTGADLSETAIRYGKEHYKLERLYCAEFPPEEIAGCFDVVIASHIIEHVLDPKDFIARCGRFLRTGGLCVIKTPNAGSLGMRVLRTHYPVFCPPIHLNYFSRATLSALLHGLFAIVRAETDSDWRDERNTVFNSLVSIAHWCGVKRQLKENQAFACNARTGGNKRTNALDVIRNGTRLTQRMLGPVFFAMNKAALGENMTVVARKL